MMEKLTKGGRERDNGIILGKEIVGQLSMDIDMKFI